MGTQGAPIVGALSTSTPAAPSRPFPAPRSQVITPSAPHAASPLEPQAQRLGVRSSSSLVARVALVEAVQRPTYRIMTLHPRCAGLSKRARQHEQWLLARARQLEGSNARSSRRLEGLSQG